MASIAERGTVHEMMANRGDFSRTFDSIKMDQNESEGEKADLEDVDADENAKRRRAATGGRSSCGEQKNTTSGRWTSRCTDGASGPGVDQCSYWSCS
jgi:hypothetical protein